MGTLDVDSFLTSTQLEETIDICTDTFFETTERIEGLSKIEFKELHLFLQKNSISFLIESFNRLNFRPISQQKSH